MSYTHPSHRDWPFSSCAAGVGTGGSSPWAAAPSTSWGPSLSNGDPVRGPQVNTGQWARGPGSSQPAQGPWEQEVVQAGGARPAPVTHRRNQRSPSPYSRPQIPERGHRQRGSFRSSITVVATTCVCGQKGLSEIRCRLRERRVGRGEGAGQRRDSLAIARKCRSSWSPRSDKRHPELWSGGDVSLVDPLLWERVNGT